VVAYALFGAGYIAYLTFVVALLRTRGLSAAQVGLFWVLLGVAAGTGFWWGGVLGKARGGRGLALLLAVLAAGAALPLVTTGALAAYGSAVLFGGSVLSTAAAVTVIARASLPAHQWNAAIAELTAVFAAGQCVGPVLAGALSDRFGGLRAGLGLSVGLLLLGAAVAVSQPDRAWGRRSPAPEKAPRRRRPAA
jgi:predicted MFS family arabinose efflux permease